MQISENGLTFIKKNEGFRATPYRDAGGKWAWGYGHDQKQGEALPASLTEAEADALLMSDLKIVQFILTRMAPADCKQNQWDALCDFGYNVGSWALMKMLEHGWNQVLTQMLRWDHSGGVVNEGLMARRQKEVQLFAGRL